MVSHTIASVPKLVLVSHHIGNRNIVAMNFEQSKVQLPSPVDRKIPTKSQPKGELFTRFHVPDMFVVFDEGLITQLRRSPQLLCTRRG